MLIEGSIMGISVFLLFLFAVSNFSYPVAQTMTFAALSLSQLTHAFNNRSTRKSLFQLGIFSNKYLVMTVFLSGLLQFTAVQTYFGNLIFKTTQLQISHWFLIIIVALIPFLVVETKKQLRFRILP
jgi:Ca2+-transporting ATPase